MPEEYDESYFEKYDQSYREFHEKLDIEFPPEDCDYNQLIDIIKAFGKEYMLPRDVWDAVIKIFFHYEDYMYDGHDEIRSEISHIALYQFCLNESILLDERYSPPSKDIYDQYKKSKALFEKIMSVEKDEEKWIEALKETNDDLFVQQNVEFRLGNDILNKKLWKLYIAYLKEHNPTV
uniref:Uncharacterized protein n=1 Tax=Panagrolaimus sp. ES5 TaxID=591445 RepID=A0AC34FZN8_9BILA